MTVISYHSTLISDVASQEEAVDKTSSQIFLSRGVAGADLDSAAPAPRTPSPTFVMSVFESQSTHVMTLGNAAAKTASPGRNDEATQSDQDSGRTNDDAKPEPSMSEPGEGNVDHPFSHPSTYVKELESTVERGTMIEVDKGEEIERGRTLERGPRFPNPLAAAESRPRSNDAAIELDVRPIEKRHISRTNTFFEDPNDPCAILDDNLLEPCPDTPISHTFSDILSAPESSGNITGGLIRGTTWSSFDTPTFNHPNKTLTTAFNDCRTASPTSRFPPKNLPKIRPDFNRLKHIAVEACTPLRSASRTAPIQKGAEPSPIPTQASRLPTEIVQQIFCNLAPADFNSARRTCRSWFISSLNRSLLETMLKRAGFSNRLIPSTADQAIAAEYGISAEWSMSKSLALECALGPDWTGNGLAKNHVSEQSAFAEVSTINFTEVAVHYPEPLAVGTVLTVSSCGRFLMVANGCLLYIYQLNRSHHVVRDEAIVHPGALCPVTSIICPRRILACSMDTSSQRYAVAILLESRMGLVCDINANIGTSSIRIGRATSRGRSISQIPPGPGDVPETGSLRGTSFLDRVSLKTSAPNSASGHQPKEPPFVFPGIATTPSNFLPSDKSGWQDVFKDDIPESTRTAGPSSRHNSLPRTRVASTDDGVQTLLYSDHGGGPRMNSMPIEDGPRSLYRNLCSDDDPPRSVAICPQRRCVAFGSSSGIELHWVDALTGQDLNRWFPLTAPSDYLFFLPPRKSIDSAKKLRLISSAAKPGERPAIAERLFGGRTRGSPFWERLPMGLGHFDNTSDAGLSQGFLTRLRADTGRSALTGGMDCSDHYHAVPLSDGYHILFTDPTTGLLCLGSDAPVGGPTKLIRKIWFQGPKGGGSPIAYAIGSDLSCGVRVVAAFDIGEDQVICLFSVPSDIFATNQGGQSPLSASSYLRSKSGQVAKSSEWTNWWPDNGLQEWLNHIQDPVPGILPRSVWPVKIRGQQIGTCSGLVDLAIDSGPHMIVWAFRKHGVATVWKLDTGSNESVKRRWIMRDGTVRESEGDGDVEMSDAPSPSPDILQPPIPLIQESYDGTTAFASNVKYHSVQYDAEGDVLMEDLENVPEPVVDLGLDLRGWYRERWASRLYLRPVSDLVEEVTGVSRIDVEIR